MDVGEVDLLHGARLGVHLLVTLQTCLALRLTRLGTRPYPLKLALELLGELGLLLPLGLQARGLRLQIGGVVALVRIQVPAIDLADPLGDIVEEVAIVRYGEHGALVALQKLLEPEDRLRIQVVGRLVEQQ